MFSGLPEKGKQVCSSFGKTTSLIPNSLICYIPSCSTVDLWVFLFQFGTLVEIFLFNSQLGNIQ